nr:hypothetical protein [Saccharothrix espanaensis]
MAFSTIAAAKANPPLEYQNRSPGAPTGGSDKVTASTSSGRHTSNRCSANAERIEYRRCHSTAMPVANNPLVLDSRCRMVTSRPS